MKKLCVLSTKGGVAKTTTAINLAAGLSMRGKKVLLLDMDPQGHVATYFPSTQDKKDMFEFLTNGAEPSECISQVGTNFDAILSSDDMKDAERELNSNPVGSLVLRNKLKNVNSYDYVIIDCPPSSTILVKNAMTYADQVIIPTSLDPLGKDSLNKTLATINSYNEESEHNLQVLKILPTQYDRRNKISTTILNELINEHYELVAEPIRINSKLREAPREKKSIFTYAPSSRGAKDYSKLVDNLLAE